MTTCKEWADCMTPEQWAIIIAALVSLFAAIIGFAVWVIKFLPRLIESRLEQSKAQQKKEMEEAQNKWEVERLEIQNRLDETQSGRETIRLFFAELQENRREESKIRENYERREVALTEASRNVAKASQGIEANTAATLELLKEMSANLVKHQESDEIGMIRLENLKTQNDKTHEQNNETHRHISELSSAIDTIKTKVDDLAASRQSDKDAIIQSITNALESLKGELTRLEENMKPPPPVPIPLAEPPPDGVTSVVPAPPLQNEALQTLPENKTEPKEETK